MTDLHTCSYHCDRPECVRAQRDELRERLAQPAQQSLTDRITILEAALRQAVEALEDACGGRCNAEYNPCWQREAITTAKQALGEA